MAEAAARYPLVGSEDIMSEKEHGTCHKAVMPELRSVHACCREESTNLEITGISCIQMGMFR